MSAADPVPFLRVEKGSADAEEIGALTILFLARQRQRAAAPTATARACARWQRLERSPVFSDPRAWTSTAR